MPRPGEANEEAPTGDASIEAAMKAMLVEGNDTSDEGRDVEAPRKAQSRAKASVQDQDDDSDSTTDVSEDEVEGDDSGPDDLETEYAEDDDEAEAEDDSEDEYDLDTDAEYEDDEESDDARTLQVKVDGKTVDVTLGDLKKQYALGVATENRLKEANDTRRKLLETRSTSEQEFRQIVAACSEMLFAPTINEPDASKARTDTAAYLEEKGLYEAEQKLLKQRREWVAGTLVEMRKQNEALRQDLITREGQALVQKEPLFKSQKFHHDLVKFAMDQYQISPDMISSAMDHRIFMLAADAFRYHRLTKGRPSKEQIAVKEQKTKARSLGKTAKKNVGTAATRAYQKAVVKARQTGSVDDVAATLAVPITGRGRRRR